MSLSRVDWPVTTSDPGKMGPITSRHCAGFVLRSVCVYVCVSFIYSCLTHFYARTHAHAWLEHHPRRLQSLRDRKSQLPPACAFLRENCVKRWKFAVVWPQTVAKTFSQEGFHLFNNIIDEERDDIATKFFGVLKYNFYSFFKMHVWKLIVRYEYI